MKSWTFRLYPEPGSRLFVRALVFARRKDLLRHWRISGAALYGRAQCQAMRVIHCDKGKPDRVTPIVAELSFWRKEIGMGTVTHECTHAGFAWARRRKLRVADISEVQFDAMGAVIPQAHPEERIASVVGEIAAQFVARAVKVGLYK